MNKKLLQKVIDELMKEKPDLSYIRGIVETMLESLPEIEKTFERIPVKLAVKSEAIDEASILDAQARAAIEKMKAIDELNKNQS